MATAAEPAGRFSFGKTVADTFSVIGRNFLTLAALALLFYGLPSVIYTVATFQTMGSIINTPGLFAEDFWAVFGAAFLFGWAVLILFYVFVQAAMTHIALASLHGEKTGFGSAIGAALRAFLPVFAIDFIYYLCVFGIFLAIGLLMVAAMGGAIASDTGGLAVGMFFLLFFAAIVPFSFLAVVWLVPVPARLAERLGIFASLGRSWSLTRGHRWKIFAILLLAGTALMVVYSMLSAAAMPFMMLGAGGGVSPFVAMLPVSIVQTLLGSLVLILTIPGVAAIYSNLRAAKEGVLPDSVADIFG